MPDPAAFDPFTWLPLPFPWPVKAAMLTVVIWVATGGPVRRRPK